MYEAIMKAANQIEKHPETYSFSSSEGADCGTPGCMWGWVGFFLGIEKCDSYMAKVSDVVGHGWEVPFHLGADVGLLAGLSAEDAAKCLRLYAEKYHAKPKVKTGIHPFVQKLLEQADRCAV